MSMNSFERSILGELKMATGNRKLKEKDLLEWRTSKIEPQDGEIVIHLPLNGVWVAYPAPNGKEKPHG